MSKNYLPHKMNHINQTIFLQVPITKEHWMQHMMIWVLCSVARLKDMWKVLHLCTNYQLHKYEMGNEWPNEDELGIIEDC